MKIKSLVIFLVLVIGSSVQADTVDESFIVGETYFSGMAGSFNPGNLSSAGNEFVSSPDDTGSVDATAPLEILEGNGDVLFRADAAGATSILFDLGPGIADTTLTNGVLLDTEIKLSGIDSPTPGIFSFEFAAQFLDGTFAGNLGDLSITPTNGTFSYIDNDGGSFEAHLTGSTGTTEIAFASTTGSPLRSIEFLNINPEFDTDVLMISGVRTLQFNAVPEPSSLIFIGALSFLTTIRRRRS